jgi:pyroglutamyl-peptidase
MPRVLLTGFGSFPNVPINPCVEVVQRIQEHSILLQEANIFLHTEILSVSYRRSIEELECLLQEPYDIRIHLGVANSTDHIRLEQFAYNICGQGKDVDGEIRVGKPIVEAVPTTHVWSSTMEQTQLQNLSQHFWAKGIPVHLSSDPGRYVCNNIYAHSLHTADTSKVLFVHIPNPSNSDIWSIATIHAVVEELILLLSTEISV